MNIHPSQKKKKRRVERQASKQQSGQQQHAAPSQLAQPELASSQPALEQHGAVPDEEPLLAADFPLPGHGRLKAPTVIGLADVKAWRSRQLSPNVEGRGTSLPVASSSHTEVLDTASPLAGKRRGPGSVSDVESAGVGEDASFFFLLLLGGMDIHYTSATIATSRLCELHHKPKRPRLTTHSESVQA